MPPGAARPMPPVELEAVAPALLLPPVQARSTVAAALAGGIFELGDRVISLRAGGDGPPFGLRGTVSFCTHDHLLGTSSLLPTAFLSSICASVVLGRSARCIFFVTMYCGTILFANVG